MLDNIFHSIMALGLHDAPRVLPYVAGPLRVLWLRHWGA